MTDEEYNAHLEQNLPRCDGCETRVSVLGQFYSASAMKLAQAMREDGRGEKWASEMDRAKNGVRIKEGNAVYVLCAGRGDGYRSEVCWPKAVVRRKLCSGCGAKTLAWPALCPSCEADRQSGAARRELNKQTHVRATSINADLSGKLYKSNAFSKEDRRDLTGRIIDLLCVLGVESRVNTLPEAHVGDPPVRLGPTVLMLTDKQQEELAVFLTLLENDVRQTAQNAYQHGSSALGKILRGEATIEAYNAETERAVAGFQSKK